MIRRVSLCLAAAALCPAAHAQLTLNQIGGTTGPGNYSTQLGASAFAKDEIGGGGLAPTHTTANVNNGTFGNASSWIGDSLNSFVGISFGAAPVPVGQVAWGRDNTRTFFDRSAGTYTLQYTTVGNPNAGTPDAAWTTIGSVTYEFQGTDSAVSMSQRHLWGFSTVNATGIRLIAPGSSFADGAAIDELEAYAFAASPLTLDAVGGTMQANNLALSSAGSAAFAKDLLGNGGFAPTHTIPNLNDGIFGNGNSWIGDTEGSFAGVRLASAQTIDRIAFGRDNTGTFGDRDSGNYLLQYTTAAAPDQNTSDNLWTTIGTVYYDPNDPNAHLRHQYSFAPVAGATGVRIFAPGNGIGSGRAIDEIEVYAAVPEPAAAVLLALGLALIGRKRRR